MRGKGEGALTEWMDNLNSRHEWLSGNMEAFKARRRGGVEELEAYDCLRNHSIKLGNLLYEIDESFCGLMSCGVCCHFPAGGETVSLRLGEVERIKGFLASRGETIGGFLEKRDLRRFSDEAVRLMRGSGCVFDERGVEKAYQVKTAQKKLPSHRADVLPRNWDGRRIWIEPDSSPCMFLNDTGRCSLYIAGIFPRFCRNFICSTGFAFVVSRQLGYANEEMNGWMDYAEISKVADKILGIFDKEYMRHELRLHKALLALGEAYMGGGEFKCALKAYKKEEKGYIAYRSLRFRMAVKPRLSDYARLRLSLLR